MSRNKGNIFFYFLILFSAIANQDPNPVVYFSFDDDSNLALHNGAKIVSSGKVRGNYIYLYTYARWVKDSMVLGMGNYIYLYTYGRWAEDSRESIKNYIYL